MLIVIITFVNYTLYSIQKVISHLLQNLYSTKLVDAVYLPCQVIALSFSSL